MTAIAIELLVILFAAAMTRVSNELYYSHHASERKKVPDTYGGTLRSVYDMYKKDFTKCTVFLRLTAWNGNSTFLLL